MSNINVVAITGNLTKDPELRATQAGMSVCSLRVAVNDRQKINGEWQDKPGFYDVTVWGTQGENAARYLSKGRPVAVQGRLQWREWESENGKRQAVGIVAESVQFLGGRDDSNGSEPQRLTEQDQIAEGRSVMAEKPAGCICPDPGNQVFNDECPLKGHEKPIPF